MTKKDEQIAKIVPCMEHSGFCLSSSELEEAVLEEDWHFLFTVIGMLQLSRYLIGSKGNNIILKWNNYETSFDPVIQLSIYLKMKEKKHW